MEVKCENCKYWSNTAEIDEDIFVGDCRRKPPRLNVKEMNKCYDDVDSPQDARWRATLFPVTSRTEWCGEWKAR